MSVLVLSRGQRRDLRDQLKRTADAAVYRRTLGLLELDRGRPLAAVARSLGVTRQTIYNWIDAYTRSFDPQTLADADRSGRPTAWTPDLRARLEALLRRSPRDWDYPDGQWTVPLLRQQLADDAECLVSEDTVRRRLHGLGYVWKRTRYVLPADPAGEKKTRHPAAAEKQAAAGRRAV
jgi:transposase